MTGKDVDIGAGVRNNDMKRTYISGVKIPQLIERGKVPDNLKWFHLWEDDFPPVYAVNVFTNKAKTRGVLCAVDSFGGGISYAVFDGDLELIGKDLDQPLSQDEREYIQKKMPQLLEEMDKLNIDA